MKLNLPSNPAIALLGLYLTLSENLPPNKNVYANIHNSFFIIAKTEKKLKCSSVEEWFKNCGTIISVSLMAQRVKHLPAMPETWV